TQNFVIGNDKFKYVGHVIGIGDNPKVVQRHKFLKQIKASSSAEASVSSSSKTAIVNQSASSSKSSSSTTTAPPVIIPIINPPILFKPISGDLYEMRSANSDKSCKWPN